jgi:outer membrane receptor protein involved in Fe transport
MVPSAWSQTVASTVRATAEAPVVLSPFEVVAEPGYYASTTLSGTRLNARVEDLASSISIVTKDLMDDFAMRDLNDVFLYEANTEGTGNYTAFEVSRFGDVVDNVAADPANANRIRGMGAANIARGGVAQSGVVPLDKINLDAVEISRGPNSSLFGLGNTAGTVNTIPARAHLTAPKSVVEFRVDSLGGWRSSLDLNRPLIRQKLALRVSGVTQEDKFERKPSFDRTRRLNAMATWQPFKKTAVRASYEHYYNFARRPNALLPRDGISYWQQSGSPTWDPVTFSVRRNGVLTAVPFISGVDAETAALRPGLESGDSFLYNRPSLYIERDGTIPLWMVNRVSTANNPSTIGSAANIRLVQSGRPPAIGPLAQSTPSITDHSIYNWERFNIAAPNWMENKAESFSVELEQFFIQTRRHLLGLQAGWYREDVDRYNRAFIGTGLDGRFSQVIYVDVNERLLDGRPNPYFLRPYLAATEPTIRKQPLLNDTYRGQLAYKLNLAEERGALRWIGDHTLAAYGEYRESDRRNYLYRDAIISEHAWLPAGSNRANGPVAARGYYRYYVGDSQGFNVDYAPPAWRDASGTRDFLWWNNTTRQWISEPATIGEAFLNTNGTRHDGTLIKTRGAVLQSQLWDSRIVTTFGWRRDANHNRATPTPNFGADGYTYDPASDAAWGDWIRRDGATTTRGAVLKPFRGWERLNRMAESGKAAGLAGQIIQSLNFHYNESDSFLPATLAQNLFGNLLPDPTGEGRDYGVSFGLPGNKLVLRYNQYVTKQRQARNGSSGTIASRVFRMDFAYGGSDDAGNLMRKATDWVRSANPAWSNAQVATEVARIMVVEPGVLDRINAFYHAPHFGYKLSLLLLLQRQGNAPSLIW